MPHPWTATVRALDVREIVRVLSDHGVEHVLVGGIAAIFHGYAGATFDADVVPDLDTANLARLASALRALDAELYADPRRADLGADGSPPEADDFDLEAPETFRRRLSWFFSTSAGRLDVLLVIDGPGGYATIAPRAIRTTVGGAPVLVIALDDLIESKETAGRPKDLAALDELRRLLRPPFEPPRGAS